MTSLHRIVWLLFGLVVLGAAPASAQFETPNRQFHDQTTFRLEGRHLSVACESCHLKGAYKGTPTKCVDCHWQRRQDDRFRLQLGSNCEQCHRPAAWTAVRFDHGAATGMPLNGAHRELTCQSCHKNDNLRVAQSTCVSCHQQQYDATRAPNHAAAGFPTTCEACHRASDVTFQGVRFDHQASFALVGPHAQASCASCHRNNVFRGTARDCVGCHRDAYTRTTTPNHAAAGFPTTCESCHRPTDASFRGVTFNHAAIFPLVGTHAQQACSSCHRNNVYRGLSRDCVGCHQDAYNRTTAPNHAAAGFSTQCESCHRPTDTSFRGAQFNHAQVFPLVGQHAQAACATCHRNGVFRGTPRECIGCHQDTYNRTTSPNHAAAGFPTTCENCHRPSDTSFRGAGFNHAQVFPLVGQHAQAACATCHRNSVFRGTPRDCVGCHQDAYNRTTAPNHAAAGFSTQCESCHRATDSSFRGASFNHAQVFPLVGQHAATACATCHRNGVFRGTPRDCVGCHQDQYTRTTAPNHASAGFSTQCETCHRPTDSSFRGAGFNHAQVFALVGRHAQTACATCHVNNVYRGTARDCVGCHRAAYDRTTSPPHAAAGFGTTCETCHRATDASFRGATFNHASVFALVGVHAQQACTACHVNNVFRGTSRTCVGCHRAVYDRTTAPAHAAAGFPTTCENCHRATDSTWRQGTFNHRFPITSGPHRTTCATCHQTSIVPGLHVPGVSRAPAIGDGREASRT